MPNLVGQQVNTYHLTHLHERTAFTEIYAAEQNESGTQVIFKALRPELPTEEQELFLDAAQALFQLIHPNITRVLEAGQTTIAEDTFPYLIVEYISDQTLRQLHPIGSSLAPTTILAYIKPVAEALYYAHQQNLVHGDVKPGNLFVGEQQRIVLSDFSTGLLSRQTNTVAGTIAYVAPEQLNEQLLPASDQYALGVIVYEWLTGELPFSGSVSEISRQHQLTPPPSLRAKIPELPESLESVVLTALAKEPEKRFASVLDFVSALETALTQVPEEVDAPSASPLAVEPSPDRAFPSWFPETLVAVPGTMPQPDGAPQTQPPRSLASNITRRALLIGLPTLAVAASGFAAWRFNQKASALPGPANSATLFIYRGHAGSVTALAWSPDGTYLASGGDDHTIQIWLAKTGATVYIFHGAAGSVPAITWAPDSQRIASASSGPTTSGGEPAQGNTVQVWQALTGEAIYTYTNHTGGITDIAWNPKSSLIASASTDYTVQIWNATTGKQLLVNRLSPWYAWSLAWSPDSQWMATGGPDMNLQVWDTTTAQPISTYQGHTGSIETVAWAPSGSILASGSDDRTIRVWEMFSPISLLIYRGHTSYVRSIAWSPDGQHIASGSSDKTVQVWETSTGANVYTYRGHSSDVTTVVWSPDGKFIASGSDDGTVQIWQPF